MKKIYTLGFFDGVHLGHQALLTACRHLAQRTNCTCGAVTFTTHPDALVASKTPPLINTVADRKRLLIGYGVRDILELPFDEKLRTLPWQDFLELLMQHGASGFVCGDDFRFGYQGQGNATKLAEFCKERSLLYAIVPEQKKDGKRISSTHIRELLEQGDMETAAQFLGHPHILSGEVQHGRHIGRTIGVPTANIAIPNEIVVPKHGVYATTCVLDGKIYVAVTNVGSRPTVGGHEVRTESWILDFDGDLYGKTITLIFHKFLRPEQKFGSLEELRGQIQKDADQARNWTPSLASSSREGGKNL